jgi:hypothetical protein
MKRKKFLFILFITMLLLISTILFLCFYFNLSTHTLVVENTTNFNVRFLILWSDGTSSDLITLEPNDKISLCKAIRVEGHSEIFINTNHTWYHRQVDDYACPNTNTKSVFKITALVQKI